MTQEQKIEILGAWVLAFAECRYPHNWYERPPEERIQGITLIKDFFSALGLDFNERFKLEKYPKYRTLVLRAFNELYGK